MVSVEFRKNVTGPPFCGGWTKKIQTFSRHLFWEQPSRYCIAEFTAISVCLLLSWSRRHSTSMARNFNNIWPLYLIFFKCNKPLPKYLIHWKFQMSAIFSFEKGAAKKTQIFHIFKRLLFRNGQPYWYECWRVLRDFCGFSKKCGFATVPEI